MNTIKTRILNKIDTSNKWNEQKNFKPLKGEFVIYQDEENSPKVKVGDGTTPINELPFIFGQSSADLGINIINSKITTINDNITAITGSVTGINETVKLNSSSISEIKNYFSYNSEDECLEFTVP